MNNKKSIMIISFKNFDFLAVEGEKLHKPPRPPHTQYPNKVKNT